MLIFGPRLDRPSAIGDEGRPRATSLTVAALVVVGPFAAASFAIDYLELLPVVGLLVGLTATGAALLGRDRVVPQVFGHLCFLPFASALLGLVYLSFTLTPYGVLVTGFAVAALGVAGSWADVLAGDDLKPVFARTAISYVSMLVNVVAFSFVAVAIFLSAELLRSFVAGVGPSNSVIGFLVVCCVSGMFVRVALAKLPIVQLAPRSRRNEVARRVTDGKRVVTVGSIACFVLAVVLALLWAVGFLEQVYVVLPAVTALFGLLSTPFVVGPVVAVGGLCIVAVVLAWLARTLTRQFDPSKARLVAAGLSGGVFVIALVPLIYDVLPVGGILGVQMAYLLAFVGPIVILVLGGIAFVAIAVGVFPDRAGGPALASAGLVLATIGTGLASLPPPLVFACAACSLVAWDVSSFGLGVTAELGHLPETRQLELFHGVLGVGLGVVAVLAVSALDLLRTSFGSTADATSAAVIAVVGVLVLLAQLRG